MLNTQQACSALPAVDECMQPLRNPLACIAAGDDELYQAQRPLPLAELHSGRSSGGGCGGGAGAGGVLCLLKMALWHALWVEVAPSPGRLPGWCIGWASGRLVYWGGTWAGAGLHCMAIKAGRQCCASLLGSLPGLTHPNVCHCRACRRLGARGGCAALTAQGGSRCVGCPQSSGSLGLACQVASQKATQQASQREFNPTYHPCPSPSTVSVAAVHALPALCRQADGPAARPQLPPGLCPGRGLPG